ncbi:MAG: hypothetical protein HXL10_01660 [Candidatus Nanosynbacter sp.]|nr:hypothetical protein [Candidatus Nanosynbacter sp.]
MRSHKKAKDLIPKKESLVGMLWCLKSLNDDEDLDKKIGELFDTFEKCETPEMEFPEGTVVRLFSSSQELTDKEFFLIKLEKVEMPKAKKRKLLVDYHKRFFNEINDVIMAEIDYVVKGKIYCATSKFGKKYYLYADFNCNIFSRPYTEEDYFCNDDEFY